MRTEQLILENLIFSDEYASLIGVFLKPEYFKAYPEKIIFSEIQNHIQEYNKPPTLPALENMITSRDDLNEATFKNCMEVLTTYKTKTDDHEWLVHETEKWAKDQAIYNGIVDSIAILEGKDTKKPKDAIPDILTDALAVSLDTSVGHNYIEDAEDRWDYYHKREQKFPFNIEMLDKITGGGITPKTLVPISLFCLVIKTAPFSLKIKCSFNFETLAERVLTTKAFTTSPFCTLVVNFLFFRIFLIDAVITSPITAYLLL